MTLTDLAWVTVSALAGFALARSVLGIGQMRNRTLPSASKPPVKRGHSLMAQLEAWLQKAHIDWPVKQVITGAALGLLLLLVVTSALTNMAVGVTITALGAVLGRTWVINRINRRASFVASELPGFLRLIAGCLRSGFSLMQAIELAIQEGPPLMASEMSRVVLEVNLGNSLETALLRLSTRNAHDDIDLVVSAILISREVGGNLSEAITTMAETILARAQLRRRLQVLTAQAKLSGMIVSALPFVLFLILTTINPEYTLILFTRVIGWAILALAVTLQLIGAWLIRRMIRTGEELML